MPHITQLQLIIPEPKKQMWKQNKMKNNLKSSINKNHGHSVTFFFFCKMSHQKITQTHFLIALY